eukprot:TRINITY_DN10464_c0_g1_i1.p1 TRINITY_DN10464_c0_g1~~TRINITY_DN10464_c0_g1_i1.p1  ORF type:complete len:167 (-),score=6.70 TRINITY_DN10464_c0_g1_i1:7-507(-)
MLDEYIVDDAKSTNPKKKRKITKKCADCSKPIERVTRCANYKHCKNGYCDDCRDVLQLNTKCSGECNNLLCPQCRPKMKACDVECGRKLCLACAEKGFFKCAGKACDEEYCKDCLGEVCEICEAMYCHECTNATNIVEPCPDCWKTHCHGCVCNAGSGSDSEYAPD